MKEPTDITPLINAKYETAEIHSEEITQTYKVARIAQGDRDGILVQWDDRAPTPAKFLTSVDIQTLVGPDNIGREVLISFFDNDPKQPLITGVLDSLIDRMVEMELVLDREDELEPLNVLADGEKITIDSDFEQLSLVCGKSSLTLKKDGKIILKGTDILTRTSGVNKIQSGSIIGFGHK